MGFGLMDVSSVGLYYKMNRLHVFQHVLISQQVKAADDKIKMQSLFVFMAQYSLFFMDAI